MKHVFLSYTYNPHPDHVAETDGLQRTVRRVIEAMDLRVLDGQDLGGRPLDAEIDKRIDDADALIALGSPQETFAQPRAGHEQHQSDMCDRNERSHQEIRCVLCA